MKKKCKDKIGCITTIGSKKPTVSSFEYRPYTDYKKFESCVAAIHGTMYIGIYGYVGGSYKLLAKESPPKAVLLLHGLNSDVSTWNALKDKEFNDKCTTLPLSGSIIVCQKVLIKTIMVIVRMIGKWLML